ncbi:hypothetical protein VTI74DRAFT_1553 [Chaetomium olivicolor]
MLFRNLALVAAVAVPALARATYSLSTYCDNPEMTPEELAEFKAVAAEANEEVKKRGEIEAREDAITINVYVHVVASGKTWDEGWIPQDKVHLQINMLNTDFARTNIKFELAGLYYVLQEQWAQDLDPPIMKAYLRKGTYQDLNLYYVRSFEKKGLGGYCTLPLANVTDGRDYSHDGCTINHELIAGTPVSVYDLGRTTVHEVGHWLGLRHTFEGGCSKNNDGFTDTAAEAEAAFGCPVGRNTCPEFPGLDPINNHMDYTYE